MLQGNESIAHHKPSNIVIWMMMAMQGGFMNMGGYLACNRFVSHVTGYATLVPFEILTKGREAALRMALVPIFFLLGAMVSGYLVDVRLKLRKQPRYYISFGLIFLGLGAITFLGDYGIFGVFGDPIETSQGYLLVSILALLCGIQNGTITTVSKAVIRTTHLSGLTTDLGIGIMRVLFRKKMDHDLEKEGKANLMRLGIILFFLFGSFVGFLAFEKLAFNGFLLPTISSGFLFFVMGYFTIMNKKKINYLS